MGVTRYCGLYTLLRGGLYFLAGSLALIFGVGGVATGTFAGLGTAVFGVLYVVMAFALFAAGGLLTVERKIGRLLAMLLLSVDAVLQGVAGLTNGALLAILWATASLAVVIYLLVWNPLASGGGGRTIDEESNAHDISVEEF